ncbi:ras guanine nucleotide exchange factor domain-containing protein [Myxozyma melibiosi]|uniref:Ras guanine nucleotide exchange factor domain-containing protein n=1 Tax=Myxozyma melibiosi TaxID=54550 RepID=A0ABR1F2P3_9ASCO
MFSFETFRKSSTDSYWLPRRSPSTVTASSIPIVNEPNEVQTWDDLQSLAIASLDRLLAAINGGQKREYSTCVHDTINALTTVMTGAAFPGFLIEDNDPIFGELHSQIMDSLGKLVVAAEQASLSPETTPAVSPATDLPPTSPRSSPYDYECEVSCQKLQSALVKFIYQARLTRPTPVQNQQPEFIDSSAVAGATSAASDLDFASNTDAADGKTPISAASSSSRAPSVTSLQLDGFWGAFRSRQNSAASGGSAPTAALDEQFLGTAEAQHAAITNVLRDFVKFLEKQPYSPSSDEEIMIEKAIKAAEFVRSYLSLLESADLTPLLQPLSPTVADFKTSKQALYDAIAGFLLAAQNLTLTDEPAATFGPRLEKSVRSTRELERAVQSITFPLQFLVEEKAMRDRKNSTNSESTDKLFDLTGGFDSGGMRRTSAGSRRNSFMDILIDDAGRAGAGDSLSAANFPVTKSERKLEQFFGNKGVPKAYSFTPAAGDRRKEDTPWYLKNDYEDELVYDARGAVKGGTLTALLERLTRHDFLDTSFNSTFLLTYRSFTNSRTLFEMLINRFTIQPPESLTAEQLEEWVERKQKPIRLRVFNIIKIWIEQYWVDDDFDSEEAEMSREVLSSLEGFTKLLIQQQFPGASTLAKAVRQRLGGGDVSGLRRPTQISVSLSNAPAPILPKRSSKKLKFSHFHALEIARQLTLIEFDLFSRIKPSECLARTKRTGHKRSVGGASTSSGSGGSGEENIAALIHYSNQLTNYTAHLILSYADVKKRANVIKHLINVADQCRQLHNFSSMTAIISSLYSATIHRLIKTWDILPQKYHVMLENLYRLIDSSRNFGEYRTMLHLISPPCVPFFGVYLTDLTFIEDGNTNNLVQSINNGDNSKQRADDGGDKTSSREPSLSVTTSPTSSSSAAAATSSPAPPADPVRSDMINFSKRTRAAEVIREIQQYQSVPYTLRPVRELQDLLQEGLSNSQNLEQLYNTSLEYEPRERGDDDKLARLLQDSGFL